LKWRFNLKMTLYIDLDGPILDVSEKYYRVYADIVSSMGGTALPKTKYWFLKRQKTLLDKILEQSGLLPSCAAQYTTARMEMIESQKFLQYDRIQPQATETLTKLGNKHILVLVTLRTSAEALDHELHRLGLRRFFQEILSAPGKPQQRYMTKVALIRSLGTISSEEGIIVGDTETDIAAGKELSLTTIAVLNGIRTRRMLEICRPDHLIDNFADIYTICQISKES
jgi:phosphoglycolate phosphatase-like HAD superfamily hydrolase